jgi:hypothetical protein
MAGLQQRVIIGGEISPTKHHKALGGSIPAIGKGGIHKRKEESITEQIRVSWQGQNLKSNKE